MNTEHEFISPEELQKLLKCGKTFCQGLLSSGEIRSYKLGKKIRRIALSDVLAYLEENRYEPGK